jgi:hypothetical protein
MVELRRNSYAMEFICNEIHLTMELQTQRMNFIHDVLIVKFSAWISMSRMNCEPRQWWLLHKSFLKLQLLLSELVLLHLDFYISLTELPTDIHALYKDQSASLLESESKKCGVSWHSEGPAYTDNLAGPQTAVYWVRRLCCMWQGDCESLARQSLRCPPAAQVEGRWGAWCPCVAPSGL